MRHRKKYLKIKGSISHRKALLSNLATELFKHKTIKTTYVKAKALSKLAERLITEAKKQTLASHRNIISNLHNKEVAKNLFESAKGFIQKGGYTKVLKLPTRHGDNSQMAIISLCEPKQTPPQNEGESKTSS
ncbi:MAG: 50S ribosomal protein L17 [bacterium]